MSIERSHDSVSCKLNTYVVHPVTARLSKHVVSGEHLDDNAALMEAVRLAQAIELSVVQADCISLRKISSGYFFTSGKADLIKSVILEHEIGLVIINAQISPIQQRNMEKLWNVKVIDRTALILEIFGDRARTAEGKMQVELAALTYQRSRLVRSWTHLERQRGGLGFVGGPGETQIEIDKRLINERILKIKKGLEKVVKMRTLHRNSRKKTPYPIVALIGYTNAGKSTLFNKITNSSVLAHDMLFATLDPTMRLVKLPSGKEIILSDTVGFISNLPTQLISSFRATLEEICEADLLIHVQDAAHPQQNQQAQDVLKVLDELVLDPQVISNIINAYNKSDLLPDDLVKDLDAHYISSVQGTGVDNLLHKIDAFLSDNSICANISILASEGKALSWLHQNACVLQQEVEDTMINLKVQISQDNYNKFSSQFLT